MSEFEVVYNESVTVQERELRVGGYLLRERRERTDLGDGVTKIRHTRWINDRTHQVEEVRKDGELTSRNVETSMTDEDQIQTFQEQWDRMWQPSMPQDSLSNGDETYLEPRQFFRQDSCEVIQKAESDIGKLRESITGFGPERFVDWGQEHLKSRKDNWSNKKGGLKVDGIAPPNVGKGSDGERNGPELVKSLQLGAKLSKEEQDFTEGSAAGEEVNDEAGGMRVKVVEPQVAISSVAPQEEEVSGNDGNCGDPAAEGEKRRGRKHFKRISDFFRRKGKAADGKKANSE